MSSIYIQEPPTSGKVLLKTTVGDIDIELWTKECPKTCRNFIQLCMDGYYNNTLFDRVVKGFIVQGGNGNRKNDISDEQIKEEYHSRLRYTRRGLVGMVNSEECDNTSQIFFTMAATPELQNKNTLFGKVTGDTIFNMLKLEEGLVDLNERPAYPQKIIEVEILSNPFEDLVARKQKNDEVKVIKKKKEAGVKNFALLSFGEEAKEDEDETASFVQTISNKGKSLHDIEGANETQLESSSITDVLETPVEDDIQKQLETIKKKFQAKKESKLDRKKNDRAKSHVEEIDSEEDYLNIGKEEKRKDSELRKQINDEFNALKKEYQKGKKSQDIIENGQASQSASVKSKHDNLKELHDIHDKYKKKKLNDSKVSRDELTLGLLAKFRKKLEDVKDKKSSTTEETEKTDSIDREIESDSWLGHTLRFSDTGPIVAKDASTKSDDWYDHDDSLRRQKRREKSQKDKRNSKKHKH